MLQPQTVDSGDADLARRAKPCVLSLDVARSLCVTPALAMLEPDALGVLLRVHMLGRLGRRVPSDMVMAARVLSTTRRRLEPAIKSLLASVPQMFRCEGDSFVVDDLAVALDAAERGVRETKRRAALVRWEAADKAASAAGKAGPAAPEAPLACKARGKKGAAKTNESQASLFGEAVDADAGEAAEPSVPFAEISALYSRDGVRKPLRVPDEWPAARLQAVRNRWREYPSLTFWEDLFDRVNRSDFLSGRSGQWHANFDWIMKPSNVIKILEGNYDNMKNKARDLWQSSAGTAAGGGDPGADQPLEQASTSSRIDRSAPFLRKAQAGGSHPPSAPVLPIRRNGHPEDVR